MEPRSPVYQTRSQGEVPLLDATAVLEQESGTVALFAVNRDQEEPLGLALDVRALPELAVGQHVTLCDQDPDAVNSATAPDRVAPSQQDRLKVTDGQVEVVLPPLSWNMLRLLPADDEVRPPR